MVSRRFLAPVSLLAALLAAAACTPESNPPQTASAAAGRAVVLPPEIERQVGPAYASPPLQALVERLGQRLVAQSSVSGSFRFYVLDQPQANAHALASGYILVTRGLLALVDDDAELAAAIGHEIAHVTLKHAAQREQARRSAIGAAVDAAVKSGSVTVGRSVANSGMLELRRYSREQELEADRVGLGYLVNAGFRGDAMLGLVEKLRRQAALDERLLGESPSDARERCNALSTHPEPDERIAALRQLEASRRPGQSDRAAYLALIDRMSVDDRPEEGFARGPAFAHPTMRLAFSAPSDFYLVNEPNRVLGLGRDRSVLAFSCSATKIKGRLTDWMRDQMKPTPTDIQATEIGGAEAAIGARPRGADTGLGQLRYVLIRHGEGLCSFNLWSDGPDRDRRIEMLVAAARSFRTLSESEASSLKPYVLRVVPRDGQTAAQFAERLPYNELRLARLLALNGVDSAAEFARLVDVKVVVP